MYVRMYISYICIYVYIHTQGFEFYHGTDMLAVVPKNLDDLLRQ